ncbi:MAG: nitrate reductase molybdenum cofactor assembly chaperone [Alphaproteobacteria bacterium]|nr:MAG: nitrate reductase molybdenum cofactor assembly chaperone [Alphaproteobacteria bacterium]
MRMRQETTSRTLKVIGLLMTYPSPEAVAAIDELRSLLKAEGWLSVKSLADIETLLADMGSKDILDLQEDYVALFDRTPSLSLHLFEHVHGDSRDRGQAMVELDFLYREKGLENASEHTPDYLPLFLEYLSILPVDEAQNNLDGAVDVIAVIGERLKKRQSPYAALFEALQEASTRKPDYNKLQSAMKADPGNLMSCEQMDAAWEEQFAFGDTSESQNGGSCPKAEDMLARMGLPADKKEARS